MDDVLIVNIVHSVTVDNLSICISLHDHFVPIRGDYKFIDHVCFDNTVVFTNSIHLYCPNSEFREDKRALSNLGYYVDS